MRLLYSIVLYLSAPLVLMKLLLRGCRNRAYLERIPERFGCVAEPKSGLPVIWVHAVSVGEVQAAAVVVKRLLRSYPGYQVLLTTITPTGAAQVEKLFSGSVEHRYLPYDLPHGINRFLRRINPRLLVILETEIWPNLLHHCKRRSIPAILVNARLSSGSSRGYLKFRRFTASAVQQLSHIAARSARDAGRFMALGADPGNVSVAGDLKFDEHVSPAANGQAQPPERPIFTDRPVWVAASTHAGEEEQVLEAFRQVRETLPDCLLVVAPRHPERFNQVYDLCRRHGLQVARRSGGPSPELRDTDVYLLDTLGELPRFYACAGVAFVGGSLVPAGGHNVLEPARLGVPVVSGRHTENFTGIIGLFRAADAITIVADAAQLAAAVTRLLTDAELGQTRGGTGQRLVQQNQGAADRVMALLEGYLGSERNCSDPKYSDTV